MAEIFGENTDQIDPLVVPAEAVVTTADPLKIDLEDADFVRVMNKLIADSRGHFKEKELYKRRKVNERYYLGQQIKQQEEDQELKPYSARYIDNVIFESSGRLKAVAVSRVPDLIVTAGSMKDEAEAAADELTDVINNRMRKREIRTVLGRSFKHRPIYFTGVTKAVWDSEIGPDGDYKYESIHPDDIDIDHTASSNDTDSMNWIAHHYPLTVKEILMRWPDKKTELFLALGFNDEAGKKEENLASTIKISEIWFTWYKKEADEWVRIEGTAWKYKTVVFDKIKNPYWDWEGETQMFMHDNELGKVPLEENDIRQSMMTGEPIQGLESEKIFYNHFRDPRKPFYFMGYEQLGKGPYDETTRIEQSLYLQDNVNVRGKQITELAALAKGKNVFSTEAGLDSDDVEKIDMSDPDQDILIDGDVRMVHTYIPGQQPTQALFQDQDINRNRLFSKMSVNAALRGERGGENTATQTQLFKESDFTTIDDEVEETINACAEWMADWAMQFIKLFYTEEHMEKLKGAGGVEAFKYFDRDIVQDGMAVEVSASSVDKMRRKREAYELAGMGKGDPVQFYKDIEMSDPEGRAKSEMLFNLAPELYMQKYIEGNETTQDMTEALGQLPVEGQPPILPPEVPQGGL